MSELSPALRQAVDEYLEDRPGDGNERTQAALDKVVDALTKKEIQLLDLVVYLEGSLNNPRNPAARRQATQLLSECLRTTPDLKLNFKHVDTFATFFSQKLGDWQCVEASATGIRALLEKHAPVLRTLQSEAGESLVASLARALFRVQVSSHTQAVRRVVLEVVSELLDDWQEQVVTLGAELGEGVVSAIDEERDPRNLLLSFRIAKRLLSPDFGLAVVTEEVLVNLFETLTSYFPITFTPPKDDKFGITGDDLRCGLSRALGSSGRLAKLVVPFLLDSSKDVTAGDNDATIGQALELLCSCLKSYGSEAARTYLVDIIKTARDQVCRTETPRPDGFADLVRLSLATSLSDVPAGLSPSWLTKGVEPSLKEMAADALEEDEAKTLARAGARRLLLAAATAHPILLARVWALAVVGPLTAKAATGQPAETIAIPLAALPFVLDVTRLANAFSPSPLSAKRVSPALAGALVALRAMHPKTTQIEDQEVAFVALGELCRLAGDGNSHDAFEALSLACLPSAKPAVDTADLSRWASDWRSDLASRSPEDPCWPALLNAVAAVLSTQPSRGADAAPALLAAKVETAPAQLVSALPRLCVSAALSLAERVVDNGELMNGSSSPSATPSALATQLLDRAVSLAISTDGSSRQGLAALVEALEKSSTDKAASTWVASHLSSAVSAPEVLTRLCSCQADASWVAAGRGLVRALDARLSPADASAFRRKILTSFVEGRVASAALLPAALPAAASDDWKLCARALPEACRQACADDAAGSSRAENAVAAVEALVVACPSADVKSVVSELRSALEPSLRDPGGNGASAAAPPRAACGAAQCMAATVAALLRCGGAAAQEAVELLQVLFRLLERDSSLVGVVPQAIQVLAPAHFGTSSASASSTRRRLPPLALQQLSNGALRPLVAVAKEAAKKDFGLAGRTALECAIALLCALPMEVACADYEEELRWCALAGVKRLSPPANATADAQKSLAPLAGVAAAQVVQLIARATSRGATWVEDDLHSVVLPLCAACAQHAVPLVRLGCLQVLMALVQRSKGHMLPFRRPLEAATRKAVEDRRREVRLAAVACLNAWQCMSAADDD